MSKITNTELLKALSMEDKTKLIHGLLNCLRELELQETIAIEKLSVEDLEYFPNSKEGTIRLYFTNSGESIFGGSDG